MDFFLNVSSNSLNTVNVLLYLAKTPIFVKTDEIYVNVM